MRRQTQKKIDPAEHFIAVKLTPKSRQRLLGAVPPAEAQAQANHVTLIANPSEDDIARFRKHEGKQVSFHATHHAHDSKIGIQAARVRGLDHLHDKKHKHVTISSRGSTTAKASNELLAQQPGNRLANWVPLTGHIEIAEKFDK